MIGVLFVCTGNICRSPTAEGVFRSLVEREDLGGRVRVDSAGTHGYHVGEAPDRRSQAAARRRGIEIGDQRARQVARADFHDFDLLVAMDRGHRQQLLRLAPPETASRVRLMLDFSPAAGILDVPDPYYGGGRGFERVLDLIEAASAGLLAHIRVHHL